MTKKVINADKEFSIIDIQKNDILSIVQIKHNKQNSFNYISLHNAFNRKLIEILLCLYYNLISRLIRFIIRI